MKKIFAFVVLSFLAIAAMGYAGVDDPPTVTLCLEQTVDPYGGGAVAYHYDVTCEPEGDCFIIENKKAGKFQVIEFCDSWGHCTKLAFVPEEDD